MATTIDKAVILDSGAFSVWSKGDVINLDEYVEYCSEHPEISYYVALDVIPGKPNDIKSLSVSGIEAACEEGWRNYLKMLRKLPIEKTIPVFHQGDNPKWLEKYLSLGCPFIGISPANDRTTDQRIRWLETLRPVACGHDGSPKAKYHGFAVTGHKVMCSWCWFSVDSATWVRLAGLGFIIVPKRTRGKWDYAKAPWTIAVSERSPSQADRGKHLFSLSPMIKEEVIQYLKEEGIGLGEWRTRPANGGKPDRSKGERWWNVEKTEIIEVIKRGVVTDDQRRKWLNCLYFNRAAEALPLEKIFLAGMGVVEKVERMCRDRLFSYLDVTKNSPTVRILLDAHCPKEKAVA